MAKQKQKRTEEHHEFEPIKLGWAIAAVAAVLLVLVGVMTVYAP